ncbi:MAG: hypothetical protein CMJ53_05240 [Planctomycetaceae bacterium]|nr:hypothetical protein [Planctomycetaceae bacterium]
MARVRLGYHGAMSSRRANVRLFRACLTGLVFSMFCSVGCQRALFPEESPRTQFETYDRMRQKFVPLVVPDVFGEPKPALRARLSSS